jgi:hypothetical protein
MIAPYNSIIKSEEEDFEEYLRKIHLIDIFKPLLEEFGDKDLFKGVVRFIAYGFSMDSDMLQTQGNTWGKIAERIYEKAGLPDDREQKDGVYNSVCLLQSDNVLETIERWLLFQNEENWTQFTHYRDLRRQFLALSLSDMKKATGEIDIEAKMKAAVYSKDLLKMMEDARDAFVQNHPKLRGSVESFNKATNNTKNSRSPGSYAVR